MNNPGTIAQAILNLQEFERLVREGRVSMFAIAMIGDVDEDGNEEVSHMVAIPASSPNRNNQLDTVQLLGALDLCKQRVLEIHYEHNTFEDKNVPAGPRPVK